MNKKAQVVDSEILFSPACILLAGIGYFAFIVMLLILRGMKQSDIMPLWVKIVTVLAIPPIAYVFALINQ